MKQFAILLSVVLAFVGELWAEVNPQSLETMTVQDRGRKKPYYTFAQESLQALSGKSVWKHEGERQSAMQVITGIWMSPQAWSEKPLLMVDFLPLKEKLGLDKKRKLFTYQELVASGKLREMVQEVESFRAKNPQEKLSRLQTAVNQVSSRVNLYDLLASGVSFSIVPHPGHRDWLPLLLISDQSPERAAKKNAFETMRRAWHASDQQAFDGAVDRLKYEVAKVSPKDYPSNFRTQTELAYIKHHPSRLAWLFYLVALILLAVTSLAKSKKVYTAVWSIAGIGFVFQTLAFVARIYISGRAPVTNMYETVIWLAFGITLFAGVFEAIYRSRYFFLAALPIAIISLILADSAPTVLDRSLHPLVPVLRSNFWLTVHVLTITLSYAAFALALGVAHIAMVQVCRGREEENVKSSLYLYLYRTLQIGVWLLATGTILGGVWANYSWGRFWGWDPKETWALIALLSYLVILHGRLAGWWGGFGLAVGSVVGFMAVLMAWYGVNFVLGTGLHSYGFGTGGYGYVITYVVLQSLFVAFAIFRKWQLKQSRSKVT